MKRLASFTGFLAAFVILVQSAPPAHSAEPTQVAVEQAQQPVEYRSAELRLRVDIYNRVKALVAGRDFTALNAMEHEFRTTRARTFSGTWKLAEFHAGLTGALPQPDEKTGCQYSAEPILQAWMIATPDAPTPYIAAASMLVDRAWCFRGGGFAGEVAQDAWAPFRETITAADKLLTSHKRIAAIDPHFYVLMEDIYRSEGREPEEFRQLLDEATAKEPYYYGLYYHAYFYFQPQWHGSIEDIDAAARYAVERTRKEDGLGAYARFYWFASSCGCQDWLKAVDRDMLKASMRDIAQRYPDPWNLANFARFGCMFKDQEVTRAYFDALGEDDGREAWDDEGYWRSCRNFAFIDTSK